jgi:hypothetical protein
MELKAPSLRGGEADAAIQGDWIATPLSRPAMTVVK